MRGHQQVQDRGGLCHREALGFKEGAPGISLKAGLHILTMDLLTGPSPRGLNAKCPQAPWAPLPAALGPALPRICPGGPSPAAGTRYSGSYRRARGGCCCSRRCTGASASVCHIPGLQRGRGHLSEPGVCRRRLHSTASPESCCHRAKPPSPAEAPVTSHTAGTVP